MFKEIGELDLTQEQDFGELYEYLIDQFGQRAGKSAGEFYTPRCLCELIFQIVDRLRPRKANTTVYDPTSGTGTLLLMCRKMQDTKLMYYGQELNWHSFQFARFNMLAHDISSFWLERGDTLIADRFSDKKFDIIVSNYPYGIRWDDKNADPERFPHGIAPSSKADYAFIQHMLNKLEWNGVCATLCFPGILFRENKEGLIRRSLIKTKMIRAVVQLPDNLFYGTSIAPALIVFNRARFESAKNEEILFVQAKDAFRKQVKQNVMAQDVIEFIANLIQNPRPILKPHPPIGSNLY